MPILEMKTSTLKQKAIILGMFSRLCQDPQALVEIYLNYDCDRESADNIYEQYVSFSLLTSENNDKLNARLSQLDEHHHEALRFARSSLHS